MMRSRSRIENCTHCGTTTHFERVFEGPRGGEHVEPCCFLCGENPARRTPLFAQAVGMSRAAARPLSARLAARQATLGDAA